MTLYDLNDATDSMRFWHHLCHTMVHEDGACMTVAPIRTPTRAMGPGMQAVSQ
jgi:hypothetical protein